MLFSSKGGILITFGRHKGKELGSLCDGYLQWMASTLQQGQCAIWGALAQQVLDERNQCGAPRAAAAAQHTLDQLDEWGVHVDSSTYAALLRQCANAKDLAEGKRVHAHIVRRGFDRYTFLGNLLVHMYSRCGDLEEACVLFNKMMVRRNLFSWNILMAAYAHNGHLYGAKRVYEGMPMRDVVSWNVMIAAYAQNGHVQEAGQVFEEAEDRDMVSWNAVIAAYAQNGHGSKALELFGRLDLEGMHPPDLYTLISVFVACASIPALAEGRLIHADLIDTGMELDVAVGNSLVDMYGKCSGVEEAKGVFDAMPQRDVVSWNSLIGACISNGELEEARRMFSRMPWRNVVSWNAMVAGYSRSGDLENAKRVFQGMPEKNVVSWNAIISGCVRNGCSEEALGLFKLMEQQQGFQADKITLVTVLDACANCANSALGESIHDKLVECGLHSDVVVANAMIHLYSKCGNVRGARSVFDRMQQRDVVSWTSMVAAHAQSGHGEEALELFRGLLSEGVQPNKITLVSVLSACSHAGLLDEGWAHFVSLDRDYGIPLVLEHYICMIDLLGRAGHVGAAQDLTKSMPYEPDDVAWRTLLSACKLHGDYQMSS